MALSAYAIWEVRSLGSDNNSGGFDPDATMKSTLSSSNGTSSTPTVTASDYTFVSGDIGYYLYIKSGTSWTPGWYLITSISSGSAVVNAASGQFIKANSVLSSSNGIGSTNSLSSGTWTIDYSQNNSANAWRAEWDRGYFRFLCARRRSRPEPYADRRRAGVQRQPPLWIF